MGRGGHFARSNMARRAAGGGVFRRGESGKWESARGGDSADLAGCFGLPGGVRADRLREVNGLVASIGGLPAAVVLGTTGDAGRRARVD